MLGKSFLLLTFLFLTVSYTLNVGCSNASSVGNSETGSERLAPDIIPHDPFQVSSSNPNGRVFAEMSGSQSVIVILIKFPDKENVKTRDEVHSLVFTSMNDYFHEVSYGLVSLTGAVTAKWYTLSRNMTYYGANPEPPSRHWTLIQDAVDVADNDVDFRNYKYVLIVHSGDSQAQSSDPNDIWSYAAIGSQTVRTRDGSLTLGVAVLAELNPLGSYAHETCHMFGLPDLYNYKVAGTADNFVGDWDLMASGSWANGGNTPVHLSSWCKIQLGWIKQSQVQTLPAGQLNKVIVNPLETNTPGTLAVKVPLKEGPGSSVIYYLVEVRRKTGYDAYLPGEGVIIYYVNETKRSGEGPVRIQSANPSLDNAARRVESVFTDNLNGIRIVVLSVSPGGAYEIEFGKAPLPTFSVTVQALYGNIMVNLDNVAYQTDQNGRVTIPSVSQGSHVIEIQSTIVVGSGIRVLFKQWADGANQNPRTVTVSDNISLVANWRTQYLLTIISPYDHFTGGWYDAGSAATFAITSIIVDYGNGTRRLFSGWTGDYNGGDSIGTLNMDGPKTVTANWKTQYFLTIQSDYGNPSGGGWYDAESTAEIFVITPYPRERGIQYVFVGWTGSIVGNTPATSLTVDEPKTLIANWKTQFQVNLAFLDNEGNPLMSMPTSVGLLSPNGTSYEFSTYSGLWLDEGNWTLRQVLWRDVDVKLYEINYTPTPNGDWTVRVTVFPLSVKVVGIVTGWPISAAEVLIKLPDGSNEIIITEMNGLALFQQLPRHSAYVVTARAQGFEKSVAMNLTGDSSLTIKVWSLTDILLFLTLPLGLLIFPAFILHRTRGRALGLRRQESNETKQAPVFTQRKN